MQVTTHRTLGFDENRRFDSEVIILRHSHIDSESDFKEELQKGGGFKEELQKGRIIKMGGLPPKVLPGDVFLRMLKNLVSRLPLVFTHTVVSTPISVSVPRE